MSRSLKRVLASMDLEEKILNSAALVGVFSVCMPWLSGEWLGSPYESFSGFGFFHTFLGFGVFFLNLTILTLSIAPIVGVSLPWNRQKRAHIRFSIAIIVTTLALASLSVLARITFESTRMNIRFGVYIAIICAIVTTLYAWLRLHEIMRQEHHEHFQHPEDPGERQKPHDRNVQFAPPPPPPPPPPMPAEEHKRHR